MTIFYDRVLKVITKSVQKKFSTTTDAIKSLIWNLDDQNKRIYARKDELEAKMNEILAQMVRDKNQLTKKINDKVSVLPTMETVTSLAEGINQRLDNAFDAITGVTGQVGSQVAGMIEQNVQSVLGLVSENAGKIQQNTVDIASLRSVVDNLVPQIVNAIDTDTLNQLIESIIAAELAKMNVNTEAIIDEADDVLDIPPVDPDPVDPIDYVFDNVMIGSDFYANIISPDLSNVFVGEPIRFELGLPRMLLPTETIEVQRKFNGTRLETYVVNQYELEDLSRIVFTDTFSNEGKYAYLVTVTNYLPGELTGYVRNVAHFALEAKFPK